jgi:hypothetical protein
LSACQQNKELAPENECIHVKIVATICSEIVYQILDSKYYDLGENDWGNNNEEIDHVFFSYLNCSDLEYLNKLAVISVIGRELDIKLITENESDFNCPSCKATLGNRPTKKHTVQFVLDGCK